MTLREKIKKPMFLLKGVATYLPDAVAYYLPKHETQFNGRGARTAERAYGSISEHARSVYSCWLRVLVSLHDNGVHGPYERVGEIGPGDSLGVGLCALLSGSSAYIALDVVPTILTTRHSNEQMLEELVLLFRRREPIPDDIELPKNSPKIASYDFPSHILTDELLSKTLSEERVNAMRQVVQQFAVRGEAEDRGISIKYLVPWTTNDQVAQAKNSIDLIFSFAALEHADDVQRLYEAQAQLLKDGGIVAHAIDYKCHHTAGLWNGHWAYSDVAWAIIRGRCAYLINRWPHSWHVGAIAKHCDLLYQQVHTGESSLSKQDLAMRFADITDMDIITRTAFVAAKKRSANDVPKDPISGLTQIFPRGESVSPRGSRPESFSFDVG